MTTLRPSDHEPVEARVAAAFRARAESVDVPEHVVDERYRELRARAGSRRSLGAPARIVLVAGVCAAAVALFLVLAGSPGLLTTAPVPPAGTPAEPADAFAEPELVLGQAGAQPNTAYTVPDWHVPLTMVTAGLPDWAGNWGRSRDHDTVTLGLESAFDTGHPTVSVMVMDEAYAPDVPWTQQDALQPSPTDVQGWLDWFAAAPGLQTGGPEPVLLGGVEAQRLTFTVSELGAEYDGCFPGRGCVAFSPLDDTPGIGRQRGLGEGAGGDLYVLEVEGRAVVVVADGTATERDRWEPYLDSVVASITWR